MYAAFLLCLPGGRDRPGVATFYPEDVETKFGTVKCMANWDIDAVFGGMDCLAIRSDAPQAVIDKLNAMLDEVYADSEFTGYLKEMGYNLWDAKGDEVGPSSRTRWTAWTATSSCWKASNANRRC